ncbi:MAG: hypothetical protein U0Y68_07285 [Blastocatellia bacterium]
MPITSATRILKKDKWKLYKVDEDFAENNDLAAKQPDKLREMVERWWSEANYDTTYYHLMIAARFVC